MSYPEHEKLDAVKERSQAIGEFLDFTPGQLCEWQEAGDNGLPRYVWSADVEVSSKTGKLVADSEPDRWDYLNGDADLNFDFVEWGDGWYPIRKSIEQLLAEWFGVDRDELEREKRAMLAELRAGLPAS